MSRSRGTKETQGINGDAAELQRMLDVAARLTGGGADVCPYPRHRGADWRLVIGTDGQPTVEGSPVTCGVCHPPAAGLEVVSC